MKAHLTRGTTNPLLSLLKYNFRIPLLYVAIGFASLLFIATAALGAGGGTGYRTIDSVRVGGGFMRVYGETAWSDPNSCSGSPTNISVVIEDTTQNFDEIVSTILAAHFAGRQVQFYAIGCATDSGNQYPKGTFVYVAD